MTATASRKASGWPVQTDVCCAKWENQPVSLLAPPLAPLWPFVFLVMNSSAGACRSPIMIPATTPERANGFHRRQRSLFEFWQFLLRAPDIGPRVRAQARQARDQVLHRVLILSLIHISEPTRRTPISYAVF